MAIPTITATDNYGNTVFLAMVPNGWSVLTPNFDGGDCVATLFSSDQFAEAVALFTESVDSLLYGLEHDSLDIL